MVAVAITGITLGLAKFLFIDNRPLDILLWALSSLAGHSTVYAEGYEESKFRSIGLGMTIRQVEDIMGTPLEKGRWFVSDGGGPVTPGIGVLDDIWHYTQAGKTRGNYWQRQVYFRDGRVYKLDRTYYVD